MLNETKFCGYVLPCGIRHDGGAGSGNFGHAGRPGEQGGSGGGGQIKAGMRVRTPYGEETVAAVAPEGIYTKESRSNTWYHPSKVSPIDRHGNKMRTSKSDIKKFLDDMPDGTKSEHAIKQMVKKFGITEAEADKHISSYFENAL